MFGLGAPELIVILAIAVLIFGGKKLPELGSSLGKAITSFKKNVGDTETSTKNLIDDLPGVKEIEAVKDQVDKVKDFGRLFKK
ncbi:MAG: twin-arginine translocase TatA/TatE family subunit [Desulfobulbaceae bacterium]|uniref:Sec-independent protein translocase protein TatA n=1 Tax=Candidatus Desulfatifera sulfidica TaxID=2841691 RepID=A0A8J6TCW0_9BACT|nr:twin-arginine translocase TatA/TatE family subunit [Candidatus Desulfatifera sulfidica]